MVNGVKKPIDLSSTNVVPIIVNSRTMVPLRFVVETLGAAITWNDSAKVITITYQNNKALTRTTKMGFQELAFLGSPYFSHLWEGELVNLLFLVNLVSYFLLLGF